MNTSDPEFKDALAKLLKYMMGKLKLSEPPPKVILKNDTENASKLLALTGYYNPKSKEITIFTTNRHPKDILRTFAHELIHYWQDVNNKLDTTGYAGQGYAQKNRNLRVAEMEAFLGGNMMFRDWSDNQPKEEKNLYKEIMNHINRVNMILEMSYQGNVGLAEMVQFYKVANPAEVREFEQLLSVNNLPDAWELVQRVVGVRLKGL